MRGERSKGGLGRENIVVEQKSVNLGSKVEAK